MSDWQNILQGMLDAGNGNIINSIIRRLFLAACVYHIWQERNNKISKDSQKKYENCQKNCGSDQNTLLGITVKESIAAINGKFLVSLNSTGVTVPSKLHSIFLIGVGNKFVYVLA
ncbi:RNA-directed DNA polymerase, eukaryota, reverse transcriptase zinc-binding domain protein [Tanacetum coccineum]